MFEADLAHLLRKPGIYLFWMADHPKPIGGEEV
jgi:hypothetical protein